MNYRDEVQRTINPDYDAVAARLCSRGNTLLLNAALGLAGESGEFVDIVKKILIHGKEGTPEVMLALKKELGDVRWYLEAAALALGFTMEEIERLNADKLRLRYPNGFTEAAALAKADLKESK